MSIKLENKPSIDIEDFVTVRIESLRALVELLLRELEFLQQLSAQNGAQTPGPKDLVRETQHYEEQLIRHALMVCGGNQRKAAGMLGVKPNTLNSKMKRYQILPEVVFASSKHVSKSIRSNGA